MSFWTPFRRIGGAIKWPFGKAKLLWYTLQWKGIYKRFIETTNLRWEGKLMGVTREQAFLGGAELGDVAVLALDQVANSQQLSDFFKEGTQAFQALAAIGIPKEDVAKVATNLAEGFLNKLNTTVMKLG